MSVNSRLKATKKTARKETFDIDILVTSRNGDRKIMQCVKITSRPPSRVEPVEPVLKYIYQSNTYRKGLSWPHFDSEPRVRQKQQMKDQQSCIFIFVACLTVPSSNKGHHPRRGNSI